MTPGASGRPARELASLELEVGQSVDRYMLLEPIGEGGMGVVWQAYDPDLARKVALKFLRPASAGELVEARASASVLSSTQQVHARLLEEARAMAKVADPHVVSVFDAGMSGDRVFMAMEFVAARDLAHWRTTRAANDWRAVVEVMLGAARGLQSAHDAGILHRDFKPVNVLIDDDGRAKVADFGLAHARGEGRAEIAGTPSYMAPELWRGESPSVSSDVFAYCVTLFELVHGHKPFVVAPGSAASRGTQLGQYQPPTRRVPRWLSQLIASGLAFEAGARPSSLLAIIETIEAHTRPLRWAGRLTFACMAVALTLIVAGRQQSSASVEDLRCARVRTEGRTSWSADRRGRILADLRGVGSSSLRALMTRFDREAQEFASAADRVCQVRGAGLRELPQLERRTECLRRRAGEHLTVYETLLADERVSAERVRRMLGAVGTVASCFDVSDRWVPPQPADPQLRERVLKHRIHGDRVRILGRGGDMDQALSELGPLLAAAGDLGYRPLLAELEFLAGQMAYLSFEPPRAAEHLQRAIDHAVASDHRRFAARAHLLALFIRGYLLREVDRVDELIGSSHAAVERVGDDEELRGILSSREGPALVMAGRMADAEAAFRESLETRVRMEGERSIGVSSAMNNLARLLSSRGQQAEAEQLFVRVVELESELVGPRTPGTASARVNLGVTLQRRGRYAQALQQFVAAREIMVEKLGSTSKRLIWPMMEEARARRALGQYERAATLFEAALELETQAYGDQHAGNAELRYDLLHTELARDRLESALVHWRAIQSSKGRDPTRHRLTAIAVDYRSGDRGRARDQVLTWFSGAERQIDNVGDRPDAGPWWIEATRAAIDAGDTRAAQLLLKGTTVAWAESMPEDGLGLAVIAGLSAELAMRHEPMRVEAAMRHGARGLELVRSTLGELDGPIADRLQATMRRVIRVAGDTARPWVGPPPRD